MDGRQQGVGPGPSALRGGQLRALDVWALGVGIVVCGQYFGWNSGLKDNGPVAMLIASLAVCLLFLAWVLTLSELAVALPAADGPLGYGRRAWGPWLGFLMGWSLFLECLFGAVATALAAGAYVGFLVHPGERDPALEVAVGLGVVAGLFFLQVWGVKEQARGLLLMTYAALAALAVFWVAAATNFSWDRVWPDRVLPAEKGWAAVLDALPYALWWLIIIEAAALAAEEAKAPDRAVPRGLTWAVVTVIGMVVLTIVTACGALDAQDVAVKDGRDVTFPLAEVIRRTPAGASPVLLYGFGAAALFGLVASYHGLLYGASRQVFALGRAGFLPGGLGRTHPTRQTPVAALLGCSLLTAGFVVANLWFEDAVKVAVLVAGFAALALYVLSMGCLVSLRRREPGLFARYLAPLGWLLPACVVLLSALALVVYPRLDEKVVPIAVGMYVLGAGCYLAWGRKRPEPGAGFPVGVDGTDHSSRPAAAAGRRPTNRTAAAAIVALGVTLAALGAVALAGLGIINVSSVPTGPAAAALLAALAAALLATSALALRRP